MAESEAPAPRQRANRVREKRVQSIMDAAEIEFASNGLSGTSVQSIADRAGLQKRQVLYFFQSKEGLYKDVIERIFQEWRSLNPVNWDAPPRKVISEYIDHLFLQAKVKPHQNKLIISDMISGGAASIQIMKDRGSRTIVGNTVALLEKYMDDGVMRRTDPLSFLFQIWSAQHFYVAFRPEVSFFLEQDDLNDKDWQRFLNQTKGFALSYFLEERDDSEVKVKETDGTKPKPCG
ncbi:MULTISPECIES: TetR family transcriptional regulator C-terminal domain-containing protein [Phaeobacter]|uniref:TetR family transcriptional regulator C-terminal domain-containing protein n=1 Tax=Phaeobacter TaxID=302485 RepID=UPI000A9E028B|nr:MULTISPECIES: TetR family transcriptional regulator C-terminal domain-containing protein [Phaeobacter]